MELRLGGHVIGADETVVMAVPRAATLDLAGTAGPTALAAVVAVAGAAAEAGAGAIEVGCFPGLIAAVRDAAPRLVIAVTVRSAAEARTAVDAGADLLIGPPEVASTAAVAGAGYAGPDPAVATAAGIGPGGFVLNRSDPDSLLVAQVERQVRTGHPVMVEPSVLLPEAAGEPEAGPDQVALAAVCAWIGVRVVKTADVATIRQVVDMVASIKGTRPPRVSRRGLA